MPSLNCLILGTDQPPAEPIRLQAGPLSMFFEPHTVFLRRICLGQTEILRGIYAAVRDRNWGTVPPVIKNLESKVDSDSFRLRLDVQCKEAGIEFRWHGELTGLADGTVACIFEGEALSTFLKSRIGFCVLHPIRECAGARARYETADGHTVELTFPKLIEPQIFGKAAFQEMRQMAHEVQPGLWAELTFEGDAFETEDQRNWTDASFKTYCTPLILPYPVEIKAGTRVRQSVILRLARAVESKRPPLPGAPLLGSEERSAVSPGQNRCPGIQEYNVPDQDAGRVPQLGLSLAGHGMPLTNREIERLRALQLAHLRVDLHLRDSRWADLLSRGAAEARQLGAALEVAAHIPAQGAEESLLRLCDLTKRASVSLARILVLCEGEPASTSASLKLAHSCLGDLPVPIGGGTNAHFCELNREQALGRFGLAEADFVAWPITPQVHAFDGLSLMETLQTQPDTVVTARAFAGRRPLALTPITLKPRFNAVATAEDDGGIGDELPSQVDPRQMSLFAACWTLGSVAGLALAGTDSATYYETTGWQGLMETETGSPMPSKFPSAPGMLFPVYHLFAALAGFRRMAGLAKAAPAGEESLIPSGSLVAVCLFDPLRNRRVLLADLSGRGQTVRLRLHSPNARLCILDGPGMQSGLNRGKDSLPVERVQSSSGCLDVCLKPYAFARVDLA